MIDSFDLLHILRAFAQGDAIFAACSLRSFCKREIGAGGAAVGGGGVAGFAAIAGAGGGASIRKTPPPAMLAAIGSPSFVIVTAQKSELCEPTGLLPSV